MSTHIGAKPGEIAERILLPGDPLRAKYIANTYLEGSVCYNEVRGMFGFTGRYKGVPVSVQGTGMGVPSIGIYARELLADYGAKTLIRVGTCGAIRPEVRVRDVILAMSASTNSSPNRLRFGHVQYAPTANFDLLRTAYEIAQGRSMSVHVGSVMTTDLFYADGTADLERWAKFGMLAVEMESAELFTLAAQFGARALSILTVSDHVLTGEETTAKERERSFGDMVEIALETAIRF
ncbi:purine-nucleoside phosphorylase [Alicyclobacillus sendaiensis]|uniref:purine-nucleoside phosphorylase n=1 Tax=Alicyclobacillus sendaiensis TaxID=192387 RepID=UPI000784D9CE|nr:purine-nucleoside phosphorylase [Alicyclobacillus sendaiensis]